MMFTYDVPIPFGAADSEQLIELLRERGEPRLSVTFESESDDPLAAGYELAEYVSEVNNELEAMGLPGLTATPRPVVTA